MARVRKNPNDIKKKAVWKVAIYIRLSREDGNDESYSVINQRQRLITHLDKLKMEEEMSLVDVYVDDGFSGTDSDRDAFQRMLSDIDSNRIDCVIVKDLSRLSRNDWECKKYLQHLFVVKNVRFISLELPMLDSFKNPDKVYELDVSIQSMYNENHCRETSIKVRGTFKMKRERGEFIGAFAPYGYNKNPQDKHRLIVDEDAAKVIRDIFHWFVREGMSKNGIVKKLVRLGVPCPSLYKRQNGMKYCNPMLMEHAAPQWSARSITTVLENKMYLGHMVQGKQKVKSYKVHTRVATPEDEWFIVHNTHEPIIDEETFQKAQDLMRRDTRTAPQAGTLYTFSGFLRCVDCKKAMVRRTSKSHVYYACRTNQAQGLCTRHSMRHDMLESMVLDAIRCQIEVVDGMTELIDEINNASASRTTTFNRLNTALKLRYRELEKIDELRTCLYLDWKSGDITRDEYRDIKKGIEEKEQQLKQNIAHMEAEVQDMAEGITSDNPYFEAFRKYRNVTKLNRGIVTELIKVIHIHEGGNIAIDFNFDHQHRHILEFASEQQKRLVRCGEYG